MQRTIASRVGKVALLVAIAAVTVVPTAAGGATPSSVGAFIDDDGNVHEPAIDAIAAAGITSGCGADIYCPEAGVTRDQMAAFLDRAVNWPRTTRDFFGDDAASVHENSINRMAAEGVTSGCSDEAPVARFCPSDLVTREQVAAFLVRSLGYVEGTGGNRFVDDEQSAFKDDIDKLAAAGVTQGCNPPLNDEFCPKEPVRRDEMASFLTRAFGLDLPQTSPGDSGTTTIPEDPSSSRWMPTPRMTWQWQLTGPIDVSIDADVYDIDLFDVSASTVSALHARGRYAVCYLSAGSWEDWRPDADDFPSSVLGRSNGWAGERWLDIREIDILAPIIESRFDLCKAKGFDAIEVDNIDGYDASTGFPLTAADQLAFNRYLADAAHSRGLSIGLKNDLEQISQLVSHYDFAVNEECAEYDECELLTPFIDAGKAVFHVEYDLKTSEFCALTKSLGLSSMRKHLDLGTWRQYCN